RRRHRHDGRLAHFEIAPPRLSALEDERAVDPHLLGQRVHGERVSIPEYYVRVLAWLERADPVIDPERPRWVHCDPADHVVLGDRHAGPLAAGERLARLLVEALDALLRVRVDDRAAPGLVDERRVLGDAVVRLHLEA